MFCNNCGYKNDHDSIYCEKCGHKLKTPVIGKQKIKYIEEKKQSKHNNLSIILPIIFITITIIILALAAIIITNFNNNNTIMNSGGNMIEPTSCSHTIEVDEDFIFGVVFESNSDISSVGVTDDNGKEVDVNFLSEFNTIYVNPPSTGYQKNTTYHITLKNAKFLNEEYQTYQSLCFKIKSVIDDTKKESQSFQYGTYTHKENYITLNNDNTYILEFKDNEETKKYTGTYIMANYVITCYTDNNITYTFNINAEGDLTALNELGTSEYSQANTIYTYKSR